MCIKWNLQCLQNLSGKVKLQEMDLKVVLGMFSDGALEMCAFFSSSTFSVHFKLSRPFQDNQYFFESIFFFFFNQLLQFIFSQLRVQSNTKTVSDFTAFNNLIGFDTNIIGNS